MPVCVLFVSSRSGIVFNPGAGVFTDHSQSEKDIDRPSSVEDPGHRKPVLISPHGLIKTAERAHDKNFISAVGGILTYNLFINSPACYH